jgi:putative nucleotidyltransferase with HDIG domain
VPKTSHRNVVLVVPEGPAIDVLLERADASGAGRRLLKGLDNPGSRDGMRKLIAAVFLQGMREGVDRAFAATRAATPIPTEGPLEAGAEGAVPALVDLAGEVGRTRSPVQMVVERFRNEELRLPAMPEVTQQLNRLLGNPDHDLAVVIDLIRRDIALSARVMKLAASPAFTLGGRAPRSLQEAIVRLGARELGQQILAFSNRRLFAFRCRHREHALRDLWHHGLATAIVAEYLAMEVPGLHAPTCFLHGLLHDIGRALLLQIFDEIEDGGTRFNPDEVERTIDSLHGQFGSALLQRWRFDDSFGEVAQFHHQPQKSFSNMKLVACVALAGSLAIRFGFGREDDAYAQVEPMHHPAAVFLGMKPEHLGGVDAYVKRQFEALGDLT